MNIFVTAAGKTRDVDAPRTIEPGKLSLQAQDIRDIELIDVLCPHDQVRTFTARREGTALVFEEAKDAKVDPNEQELAKIRAMSDGDLQAMAAELQVAWDEVASRDTMVKRIFEAWRKV